MIRTSHIATAILALSFASGCGVSRHAEPAAIAPAMEMESVAAPAAARAGFNTESYDRIVESEFLAVHDAPLSTFSVDVDTASYSNVRRFLEQGERPPADAVRIEELINYFSYDYPNPTGVVPFAVVTEVGACPWNEAHRLVHIGVQAKRLGNRELPPKNLVFLLDVSGSMEDPNKLPLLKSSLAGMLEHLGERDRVALVVYAGASGLVLRSTPASQRERILAALDELAAGGSTNGGEGIELAYRVAQEAFIPGGINRVLLATDGDFNVGVTSRGELSRLIADRRKSGVYLTVLGFGTGNYKDAMLEQLSAEGNGNFAYIDGPEEARKVLVDEMASTLVTVAKDVKIQVEFNPAKVGTYRLIGYENRILQDRDFNDDAKDAGDIGAGHSVTALYEIVPPGDGVSEVDPLRYQTARAPRREGASGEYLTVKLRYKDPDGEASRLVSRAVAEVAPVPSTAFRFSASVAAFGMLLRDSQHKGTASMHLVTDLAGGALGTDPRGLRRDFLRLARRAGELTEALRPL